MAKIHAATYLGPRRKLQAKLAAMEKDERANITAGTQKEWVVLTKREKGPVRKCLVKSTDTHRHTPRRHDNKHNPSQVRPKKYNQPFPPHCHHTNQGCLPAPSNPRPFDSAYLHCRKEGTKEVNMSVVNDTVVSCTLKTSL